MLRTITATIGGKQQECVNSRELYAALGGTPTQYARFMKDKLLKYTSFKEDRDYSTLASNNTERGRPTTEYLLSIDCAMHIAVMSQTSKGEEMREYLLSLKKQHDGGELIDAKNAEIFVEIAKYLSAADVRKQMLNAHLIKLAGENGGRFDIAQNLRKNICEIDKPKLIEIAIKLEIKNAEKLSVDALSTAIDARMNEPEYFNTYIAAVDLFAAKGAADDTARKHANSIRIIAKQGNFPDVDTTGSLHQNKPNYRKLNGYIGNSTNLLGL